MQLTCPNCGARYRIDASDWPQEPGAEALGPGEPPRYRPRRARCKLCRTVWAATPEEEVLELDDPLPPDEEHPRLADAAWAAVGGWPDPRPLVPPPAPTPAFTPPLDRPPPVFTPPGFAPPRDPAAPLYAPPVRPPITFEAPPVPIPAASGGADEARGDRAGVRARLPGPGAFVQVPRDEVEAERESFAVEDAAPAPEPEEAAEPYSWDEEAEEPRRRLWPWLVLALLVALLAWTALVLTGRVRPEAYGLPPFDPSRIGLSLPAIAVPEVRLPRAPLPPLGIEAEVVRRSLPGDRQVWEIAGTIRNPTSERQQVPPVEILLLDAGGGVVGRWTVRPEAQQVAAGSAVRFETSAIDPPTAAVRLRMQLKPAELGRL